MAAKRRAKTPATGRKRDGCDQTVTITRSEGGKCWLSLALEFDPQEMGDARSRLLYSGFASALAAVLTPEECAQFMKKLEAEQKRVFGAKA